MTKPKAVRLPHWLPNLGGASEEGSGLARFKTGFGAARVELEAATVQVGGAVRRGATRAGRFVLGLVRRRGTAVRRS